MKQTKLMMGMPITVEIIDERNVEEYITDVFDYFTYIDNTFSTYKKNSEISKFNRGEIKEKDLSDDIKEVFFLSEQTKHETNGYFNIKKNNVLDPSGLVKGWAIYNASKLLKKNGIENFYIDAGGDIQVSGKNNKENIWTIGIKNPFNQKENVKIVQLKNKGIATSGTYLRGQHVYDPFNPKKSLTDIVSITVIGPNVYEADRFATAAFAMQEQGVAFINSIPGLAGYMIDSKGIATYTSGFEKYVR